ncbi:Aminopeptidase YwaD [bacterium HR17]|uniref:Aminopeptidase YwaD n=1 Tax=Candidatus Fervidibacter japonicus TaxID=2035412 RepID=A0A2H5XEF3_9BACT|nr:Aminopeptidase YwaD [bacterium HR17]
MQSIFTFARRWWLWWALIAISSCAAAQPRTAYRSLYEGISESNLRQTVSTLASFGSRVVGFPGERLAAEYVRQQFLALGLDAVREQPFETVVPVDEGATLDIPALGKRYRLYALWPNLIRTSQTPPEGLRGHLIYAGTGRLEAFNGKKVQGSIALVEFESSTDWLNAIFLGGKAVIFIEPQDPTLPRGEAELKFLTTPIDIPRYWLPRSDAAELLSLLKTHGDLEVVVRCRMPWRRVTARNIAGVLWGVDPKRRNEVVVLQAYYDSMSVVPALSPGAEQASGLAVLLELARLLKRYPPDRTVVFLATSAHCLALRGEAQFVYDWLQAEQKTTWDDLKKMGEASVASFLFRHLTTQDAFAKGEKPVLLTFLSLDLSTRTPTVGVFYKGYFWDYNEDRQWQFSDIGKLCRESAERVGLLYGFEPETRFVDAINPIKGKSWRTYCLGRLALGSEMATIAGKTGIALATVNDGRPCVDTPFDTPDRVNFANLTAQAQVIACVVYDLLRAPTETLKTDLEQNFCVLRGEVLEFDPKRSVLSVPDQPVFNALVTLRHTALPAKTNMGVRTVLMSLAKSQKTPQGLTTAVYELVGIPMSRFRGGNVRLEGYTVDPRTGQITRAPDLGYMGAQATPLEFAMDLNEKERRLALFQCRSMMLFDMVDQRRFSLLGQMYVYDTTTGSEPFFYGYSLPIPQPMTSYYEPCAVVYAPPGTRVKVTMGASVLGLQLVLINAPDHLFQQPDQILRARNEEELGEGFLVDDTPAVYFTPLKVAKDMWVLDEYRIQKLRRYGVENPRMSQMHKNAREFLLAAEQSLKEMRYDRFMTNARAAWSYEAKAYPDAQSTAMDVVKGILFYLALLIPFAYFTERLFFYMSDLKWQIVMTVLIFAAITAVMRYVHPAFAIVTVNPLIVVLAFIILTLAVIVSVIIIQKFEAQMRQIQSETSGMHTADVGRLSATAAAFNLGVSNMRRRKVRTVLTAVTLILLTFTVLSFTSVVPYVRVNKVAVPRGKPVYAGVLIRDRAWNPLGEPTTRILRDEYGDRFPIAPRAWYFSEMVGNQSFVDVVYQGKVYSATAIVGMHPDELKITPIRKAITGRWFKDEYERAALIPTRMAQQFGINERDILLGLRTGDLPRIQVLGMSLPVIGIVKSEVMKNIVDLDGEPLTPVDYLLMQERQRQQQQAGQQTAMELEEYIHLNPDAVLYLPFHLVMAAGGNLRSVAINMGDEETVSKELQTLIDRTELNLFAVERDRSGRPYVVLCSSIGTTGVSGVETVFIPIVIAALIVLNTMLSAVYERIREIGIYTALGLAPVHIGALFLAESAVYAVLGAIVGYMLGQLVAMLQVHYQLIEGLNLNYSSVAAVFTVLVVMATVLGSTLYPAWKASQVSVPGIERRWRLPQPEGDYLHILLPFTVSSSQAVGIMMFLREYLEAHTDYSLGHFSTDRVQMSRFTTEHGEGYRLECMVWLAPYDLGVSEYFIIETRPTEDIFVNTIHITIRRESGDESSWLRVTRNFLNLIRKQFLLWRTLRPETKEHYIRTGWAAVHGVGEERIASA